MRYMIPVLFLLLGNEVISLAALCVIVLALLLDLGKEVVKHGNP